MSEDTSGRPEGRGEPAPDESTASRAARPGPLGGGAQGVRDLEHLEGAPDTEAERIRADRIAEPGGLSEGVVGGAADETEAVRIRSDDIAEPEGIARDAGRRRFKNEAERIRSDRIVEPPD